MNYKKIKYQFFNDGFVVVKNLINLNEIKEIFDDLKNIKKIITKKNNKQFFHYSKKKDINSIHNINTFRRSGGVIEVSKKRKIILIAEKIFGEKMIMRNCEFFLKPKKNGLSVPFHQDNYYWNIKDSKALNVWIACSKSSKKNGGLCYLKNSHQLGTINHKISFMKGSSQKISDEIIKKLKFKKVFPKLNIGDVVFHHCETIHGSYKNSSNQDRIGLAISYKSKKSKIDKEKNLRYKLSLKNNLKKLYN